MIKGSEQVRPAASLPECGLGTSLVLGMGEERTQRIIGVSVSVAAQSRKRADSVGR